MEDLAIAKGFQDAAAGCNAVSQSLGNFWAIILGESLDKGERKSLCAPGEGAGGSLSSEQVNYAMADTIAGLRLFDSLSLLPSVNLHLPYPSSNSEPIPVAIFSGKVCAVVARGFVDSPQPTTFQPSLNLQSRKMDSSKQIVVRVSEILAPAFRLAQHGCTLARLDAQQIEMGAAILCVLVSAAGVRTRSTTPTFTLPAEDLEDGSEADEDDTEEHTATGTGVGSRGKVVKGKLARKRVLDMHASEDKFSEGDSEGSSESDSDTSGDNSESLW